MTDQRGFEEVRAPTELAEAPPPPPPPSRRRGGGWWPPSGLALVAMIVLIAGTGVGAAGMILGSSDEPAVLRQDIRAAEQAVSAARTQVQEATAEEVAVRASVEEYLTSARAITDAVGKSCDCGERLATLRADHAVALRKLLRNPSEKAGDRVNRISDRLNTEAEELMGLLEEVRTLAAGLPPLGVE